MLTSSPAKTIEDLFAALLGSSRSRSEVVDRLRQLGRPQRPHARLGIGPGADHILPGHRAVRLHPAVVGVVARDWVGQAMALYKDGILASWLSSASMEA